MTLLQAYLRSPKARRALSKRPGDKGFSLIELVVVVAILAILAAVALPNFLGVSKDGQIAAAKNTLATAVKECSVKETRTGSGTIGQTKAGANTGANAPVQALGASLNGYNLVKLPGATFNDKGEQTGGGISSLNAKSSKIVLTGDDKDASCYDLAAVSQNDNVPTFSIAVNTTTGTTSKQCYIPTGTNVYSEGCYQLKDGAPDTDTTPKAGETGGW